MQSFIEELRVYCTKAIAHEVAERLNQCLYQHLTERNNDVFVADTFTIATDEEDEFGIVGGLSAEWNDMAVNAVLSRKIREAPRLYVISQHFSAKVASLDEAEIDPISDAVFAAAQESISLPCGQVPYFSFMGYAE
ncbi:hypothetical protein CLAC_01575 [Corynebacterium lactis RW2-5]|uniref:Uncharacterized protein n=2 Tax=Corynebacterium lactis TaxID=1231000 RepID=A0A0K2H365_9CORY|nr:hypothetical protein CLAC_01575 [Corynebacterium lactis RW2-5]